MMVPYDDSRHGEARSEHNTSCSAKKSRSKKERARSKSPRTLSVPYGLPDGCGRDTRSDKPASRKKQRIRKQKSSRNHDEEVAIKKSLSESDLRIVCDKLSGDLKDDQDYLILTNRWHLWVSACLSSLVFAVSIVISVPVGHRSGGDIASLALSSISFFICGAITGSFFQPSMHSKLDYMETAISFSLVCVWSFVVYLTMNVNNYLALTNEAQVWNWNLFCSGWISFGLVVYLFCHLMTIDVRSAMLPSQYRPNNIIRRTWLLTLFLSITLFVVTILSQSQGACTSSKVDCSSIDKTAALAGLGSIISISSFCLYLLWQMDNLKDDDLARYGAMLAFILLMSNMVNIAVTSGAHLDAIGSKDGSVFFLCWGSFWLSLYLCLRYTDVFSMMQVKAVPDDDDTATAPYSRASSRGSAGSAEDLNDSLGCNLLCDSPLTPLHEAILDPRTFTYHELSSSHSRACTEQKIDASFMNIAAYRSSKLRAAKEKLISRIESNR